MEGIAVKCFSILRVSVALAVGAVTTFGTGARAADVISHEVVVIVGAPGEEQFQSGFAAAGVAQGMRSRGGDLHGLRSQ
jgi:hypothetical protein